MSISDNDINRGEVQIALITEVLTNTEFWKTSIWVACQHSEINVHF